MRTIAAWPWVAAVAVAALVFHPILAVQFHTDDFLHLYDIENLGVLVFLPKMHGGHLLVGCNAFFALFHALFGTNPVPYMASVLLTHLLSVALLVRLLQRLHAGAWLACAGGVLWGTSPINAGALGWYSVYGQVLATALVLVVLLQLARVADGAPCGRAAPWAWGLAMLAAGASFGVGIALALVMPAVAWLWLPPSAARRHAVLALSAAAVAMVLIYVAAVQFNLRYYPIPTEFVGAGATWWAKARFLAHLPGVGIAALALGPFYRPALYPGAWIGALIAAFSLAVAFACWRGGAVRRRQILAGLLLATAAYAIIVAGRTTPFFAERITDLVRAPRYHYAAPVGLALAAALVLRVLSEQLAWPARARRALAGAWAAALLLGHAVAGPPIDRWSGARAEAARILSAIAAAAAAAPPGADVYIENRGFYLSSYLFSNFPGWAALFAIYHPDGRIDGRRVYFVVADPAQRAAWQNGRRGAALLVAPEQVPPGA